MLDTKTPPIESNLQHAYNGFSPFRIWMHHTSMSIVIKIKHLMFFRICIWSSSEPKKKPEYAQYGHGDFQRVSSILSITTERNTNSMDSLTFSLSFVSTRSWQMSNVKCMQCECVGNRTLFPIAGDITNHTIHLAVYHLFVLTFIVKYFQFYSSLPNAIHSFTRWKHCG